jgi:hypothetical protein
MPSLGWWRSVPDGSTSPPARLTAGQWADSETTIIPGSTRTPRRPRQGAAAATSNGSLLSVLWSTRPKGAIS